MLWLGGSALGGAIVALPDAGGRVFSLSESHGPSAVDLVGVAVLLAGWLPVPALLWSSRRVLRPQARWLATAAVTGVAVLVATIMADLGAWWVLGVALLVAVQVGALALVARAVRTAG